MESLNKFALLKSRFLISLPNNSSDFLPFMFFGKRDKARFTNEERSVY